MSPEPGSYRVGKRMRRLSDIVRKLSARRIMIRHLPGNEVSPQIAQNPGGGQKTAKNASLMPTEYSHDAPNIQKGGKDYDRVVG